VEVKRFVGKALCMSLDTGEIIAFIWEKEKIKAVAIPEDGEIREISFKEINELLDIASVEHIYKYEFPEDDPLYFNFG